MKGVDNLSTQLSLNSCSPPSFHLSDAGRSCSEFLCHRWILFLPAKTLQFLHLLITSSHPFSLHAFLLLLLTIPSPHHDLEFLCLFYTISLYSHRLSHLLGLHFPPFPISGLQLTNLALQCLLPSKKAFPSSDPASFPIQYFCSVDVPLNGSV